MSLFFLSSYFQARPKEPAFEDSMEENEWPVWSNHITSSIFQVIRVCWLYYIIWSIFHIASGGCITWSKLEWVRVILLQELRTFLFCLALQKLYNSMWFLLKEDDFYKLFFNAVEEFAFWNHLSKRIGRWNRDMSLQSAGEIKAWARKWRRRLNVGGTAVPIEKGPGGKTWHLEPHNWEDQRCIPYSEGAGMGPAPGLCPLFLLPWLLSLVKSTVEYKAQTLAPSWVPFEHLFLRHILTLGPLAPLLCSPAHAQLPPGEYFPVHIQWPRESHTLSFHPTWLPSCQGRGRLQRIQIPGSLEVFKRGLFLLFSCQFGVMRVRSIPVEDLFGHQVAEWLWQMCWLQKINH